MPPYTAVIVKRVHHCAVIVCSLVRQLVGGVWLPPRATAPLHTTILSITKRQLITALGLACVAAHHGNTTCGTPIAALRLEPSAHSVDGPAAAVVEATAPRWPSGQSSTAHRRHPHRPPWPRPRRHRTLSDSESNAPSDLSNSLSSDDSCPSPQSSKRIQTRTHATTCFRKGRASGSARQAIRLALRCHCH